MSYWLARASWHGGSGYWRPGCARSSIVSGVVSRSIESIRSFANKKGSAAKAGASSTQVAVARASICRGSPARQESRRSAKAGSATDSAIPASDEKPSHTVIHVPPLSYIASITGAASTNPRTSLTTSRHAPACAKIRRRATSDAAMAAAMPDNG